MSVKARPPLETHTCEWSTIPSHTNKYIHTKQRNTLTNFLKYYLECCGLFGPSGREHSTSAEATLSDSITNKTLIQSTSDLWAKMHFSNQPEVKKYVVSSPWPIYDGTTFHCAKTCPGFKKLGWSWISDVRQLEPNGTFSWLPVASELLYRITLDLGIQGKCTGSARGHCLS